MTLKIAHVWRCKSLCGCRPAPAVCTDPHTTRYGKGSCGSYNQGNEAQRGCIRKSPAAAVTDCHKLSGFKQHTFPSLTFLEFQSPNESCEAKLKTWAELTSFWGLRGGACSLSFPLEETPTPLAHVPFQRWRHSNLCFSIASSLPVSPTFLL